MPDMLFITIPVYFVFGLIFIYGLINAINPEYLWRHFESCKATSRPTNTFFFFRRLSGIFAMLLVAGIFAWIAIIAHINR